jgi:hypothetical protein
LHSFFNCARGKSIYGIVGNMNSHTSGQGSSRSTSCSNDHGKVFVQYSQRAYPSVIGPSRTQKPFFIKEMLVGAVGIEINTGWNFKELEEMQCSAKTLKRNSEESHGILIGPPMAPHFFEFPKDSCAVAILPTSLTRKSASGPNLAARMASRPSTVTGDIRSSGSRLGRPSLQSPFRGLARQELDCNPKPDWQGSRIVLQIDHRF